MGFRTVRIEGDGSFEPYDSHYFTEHGRFLYSEDSGEWTPYRDAVELNGDPGYMDLYDEDKTAWFAYGCNAGGMEPTRWIGPAETEDEALALAMAEFEE